MTTAPTTCSTCRGIHILVAPKFCPACGEQLLELPQTHPAIHVTDAEIKHAAQFSPGSVTPAAAVKKSAEPFTPAQMLDAIDQWLEFGERLLFTEPPTEPSAEPS